MRKLKLIDAIRDQLDMTQKEVGMAIESTLEIIKEELEQGRAVIDDIGFWEVFLIGEKTSAWAESTHR